LELKVSFRKIHPATGVTIEKNPQVLKMRALAGSDGRQQTVETKTKQLLGASFPFLAVGVCVCLFFLPWVCVCVEHTHTPTAR